jgi:hypothetical protein
MRALLRRYPGIYAWALILATVIVADTLLIRAHKPTMSRTWGHALRNPILGPVLVGLWRGLDWHLNEEEPFQWCAENNPNLNR